MFTTNFRDFEKFDEPELNESQMMIRRARLKFDGHVFNPKWVYKVELALGNRNIGGISEFTNMGARLILDAVIKYQFTDNFSIWFGQTKLPGNRERVVSSQKMQFVDRNIINSRFNLDRDMGFQLHGSHKINSVAFRTAFAFSMGEGRNITETNLGGFMYTVRGEILPFGHFTDKKGDYVEADLVREKKPKLAIGVSFDYNDRAARARGNQGSWMIVDGSVRTNSLSTLWVDFIFKYKGWSFQGEYANRTSQDSPLLVDSTGTTQKDFFYVGHGYNLQTGYVFKRNWELGARFSKLFLDEIIVDNKENNTNQYTLVVSKYIVGHSLKIQSDITYTHYELSETNISVTDPLMFRFQVELAL